MKELEFWFDLGSPYSYLSAMRIEELATSHGVKVHWYPFLLGPIFKQLGLKGSTFNAYPQKSSYLWRDVARQAAKYGITFSRPAEFPRRALLATRIAIYAADAEWVPEFCRRIMIKSFTEDCEVESEAVIHQALNGLVKDAEETIGAATQEENKEKVRLRTERAAALGIFGAPNFFVGNEMFWGDDRLEDAIKLLLSQTATR